MTESMINDALVRELGPVLTSFARRRGAGADAEDLVQEMWISALRSLHSFEGRASLRSWLNGILRRRMADSFRRTRTATPYDEQEHTSLADDVETLFSQREEVSRALSLLPDLTDLERAVLQLCVLDELDRTEAADKLGITRAHLRVALHRARRKLESLG